MMFTCAQIIMISLYTLQPPSHILEAGEGGYVGHPSLCLGGGDLKGYHRLEKFVLHMQVELPNLEGEAGDPSEGEDSQDTQFHVELDTSEAIQGEVSGMDGEWVWPQGLGVAANGREVVSYPNVAYPDCCVHDIFFVHAVHETVSIKICIFTLLSLA